MAPKLTLALYRGLAADDGAAGEAMARGTLAWLAERHGPEESVAELTANLWAACCSLMTGVR